MVYCEKVSKYLDKHDNAGNIDNQRRMDADVIYIIADVFKHCSHHM